jgi:hypothetical protein
VGSVRVSPPEIDRQALNECLSKGCVGKSSICENMLLAFGGFVCVLRLRSEILTLVWFNCAYRHCLSTDILHRISGFSFA